MKIVLGSDGSIELTRGEHITRGQDKSRRVFVEWAEGVSPIDTGQFLADNMVVEMCITRPDGEQSGWQTAVKVDGEIKYLYILQAWDTAVSGQASLQVRWYDITQEEENRIIEVSNEAFFIVDNGKIAQPLNLSSENYNDIVLRFITPLSTQAFRKYDVNALPDTIRYSVDGEKTAPALYYNFVKGNYKGLLFVNKSDKEQTELLLSDGNVFIRTFKLLDKAGEFNGFPLVDTELSTTSENPVQNKVVSQAIHNRVHPEQLVTINGQSLIQGKNVNIEIKDGVDEATLNEKLTEYQKIYEIELTTERKTIVGAINELNEKVANAGGGADIEELLSGKLDKVTTASTYNKAYVKDTQGNPYMMDISQSTVASSIVQRDSQGQIVVKREPIGDYHAASKEYVDKAIAKISGGSGGSGGSSEVKYTFSTNISGQSLVIYAEDNGEDPELVNGSERQWLQCPVGFIARIKKAIYKDEDGNEYTCNITIGETAIDNALKGLGYCGANGYVSYWVPLITSIDIER